MRFIFDLDGTVIDSTHRQASHEDGTLDLEHWVEKLRL
jgi:beta-phosphoglucomutase-like phosphatase (HAD superfamily)